MIDFEDQPEGEVYDMTALAAEMFERAPYTSRISVDVKTEYTYANSKKGLDYFHVTFSGDAGEWCSGATHIEDVVNFSLPDGDRVVAMKKRAERLAKKSEDLKRDAMCAKLVQVAEVRHQHPIARFNLNPEAAPLLLKKEVVA